MGLGDRGIKEKGKRTHVHGQQYSDYGREGAERSVSSLNGNGKMQLKNIGNKKLYMDF